MCSPRLPWAVAPAALLLVLLLHVPCRGETAQEIYHAALSSFSMPLNDLMEKEHDSEWRNLFSGFSGNVAFNYPLADTVEESRGPDGTQTESGFRKATVSATFKYNPLSYWFASVTFYGYLNFDESNPWCPDCRAPWDPDFSYVFGYDDWHPYTFSLTYANYGGNRLNPDKEKGEKVTDFSSGTYSLGWKFLIPRSIEELFIVHPTGGLGGGINYNLTPTYSDLASGEEKSWKQSLSLTLKYTIYKWWYATITCYYYPRPDQQQPWDPDYTYGFGYFDWHPGTVSVQYNNYSGNRYPWNESPEDTGSFKYGSISVLWSWVW
ncbi:hypothetical protein [Desulfoluna butyratoxydans]|nr:hypothetical protein [Desulfoluna butyratoxydans]